MRLRLGLLRDPSQAERAAARDPAEIVQSKRQKLEAAEKAKETTPEPSTSSRAKDGATDAAAKTDDGTEKVKVVSKPAPKPRIRPLPEAKAIDTGATFISEAFLFLVTGSLIVFESWRSRRKENTRREDVADRLAELEENEKVARQALVALEKEVLRLRTEKESNSTKSKRILPKEVWGLEEDGDARDEDKPAGWRKWLRSFGPRTTKESVIGEDQQQQKQDKNEQQTAGTTPSPPPSHHHPSGETAGKDEPLATRIAHSVATMRQDATPPPTSPTGETEAVIDSTS
ncbi:hypothetical protein GP486_006152 [Trichoglossum hirsutum]|uniref:OPA3-like protein n=1 Tax=Trichoglossum hirsutum TaxID=265104 RepID=A0A9P8L7X0_9PEZI|nr:hypothetical protein GP486_006152 [Trichoglossum hirsutum]